MGLAPGALVSRHVKLVRMLKRGGMGSVWVADHLALKTQVAVKFMSGAASADQEMVDRFEREASLAAQIKSPHVVQIHDHGKTPEGEPFIVMELLEGEDLATRLKREGPMPLDHIASILVQASRVLGKTHQMGIVHRDIKPSNLFLVDNQGDLFVKVLDFGVAKTGSDTRELTSTGVMFGTIVYMSPEQLLSARKVDHRADLWSLAVVAYRAITGALPFKDDDGLGALCKALEAGIFFPPSAFVDGLPPEVDEWFERAFQRNPDARFASAREFADEFCLAVGKPAGAVQASVRGDATVLPARSPESASVAEARTSAPIHDHEPSVEPAPKETPRRASFIDDTGTLGAAPSQTLAEAAAPRPRAGLRRALLAVAAISVISLLGLAGAVRLGKLRDLPVGPLRALAPPIVGEPGAVLQAPTAAAAAPLATGVTVTASTSAPASAAAKASTAPSAAPVAAASSSAAASPSSSAKPSGRGTSRSNKPEKDYGF